MKLVSYIEQDLEQLGIWHDGKIYNLSRNASRFGLNIPDTMEMFLLDGEESMEDSKKLFGEIESGNPKITPSLGTYEHLLAPVPHPSSCRDGYAFRQHVEAARRNRKVEMLKEFDQYPVFYFTNHHSI